VFPKLQKIIDLEKMAGWAGSERLNAYYNRERDEWFVGKNNYD